MKPIVVLLAFVLITPGCSKEQALPIEKEVVGSWKWQGSVGGLTGTTRLDPPPDGEVVLNLHADHTFRLDTTGQTTVNGNYSIVQVTSIFSNKSEAALRLMVNSKPMEGDKLIKIQGDQLTLTDNHVESFRHNYKRTR